MITIKTHNILSREENLSAWLGALNCNMLHDCGGLLIRLKWNKNVLRCYLPSLIDNHPSAIAPFYMHDPSAISHSDSNHHPTNTACPLPSSTTSQTPSTTISNCPSLIAPQHSTLASPTVLSYLMLTSYHILINRRNIPS